MYVKLDSMARTDDSHHPYDWCEQCDMTPILNAVNDVNCKYLIRPKSCLPPVPRTIETGIYVSDPNVTETKIDITPIISELAQVYDEMTSVTSKLHNIVSDPEYSFFEEDFYIVAKRWRELSEQRQALVKQLTKDKEISNMSEYVQELCTLSKLNNERNQLVDELTTLVSIPFKTREDEYKSTIEQLENEIKTLKQDNARLTSVISESSIHATNYARTKDEEIAYLIAKYDKLDAKYNELLIKKNDTVDNTTTTNPDVDELRTRLEELVNIFKSG
jgi:chromosome segregation ATPase